MSNSSGIARTSRTFDPAAGTGSVLVASFTATQTAFPPTGRLSLP